MERQGASVKLEHLEIIRKEAKARGMKVHTLTDEIIESGLKVKRLFEVEPVDNLPKTTHAQGKR